VDCSRCVVDRCPDRASETLRSSGWVGAAQNGPRCHAASCGCGNAVHMHPAAIEDGDLMVLPGQRVGSNGPVPPNFRCWRWPCSSLSAMASLALTIERRIAAPQQAVWDIITDIPGSIERIDAIVKIEMLTDQGMGVGTRWKETRIVFKRESTEEMEVIEFEPPLRYVVEANSCGAHFVSELRCEPDGEDSSRLIMIMETTPVAFFAKLMKPLAKLAMGTTRKILVKDLDDIAKACTNDESDPPSEETDEPCQP
jgi:hypothetical protein